MRGTLRKIFLRHHRPIPCLIRLRTVIKLVKTGLHALGDHHEQRKCVTKILKNFTILTIKACFGNIFQIFTLSWLFYN